MPPKNQTQAQRNALANTQWRNIRAYWQGKREPQCMAPRCLLPGTPIRYDGKRGRDSLDVGHVAFRDQDSRVEWTLADTRPEHSRCNRSAGARYRQRKYRTTQPQPIQSQKW